MPTFRIVDRLSGKVIDPAMQADTEFEALSGYDGGLEVSHSATLISPSPPAMVYTIVWSLQTARGIEVVESFSTGSRSTAIRLHQQESPGRSMIEETLEINKSESRKRRS